MNAAWAVRVLHVALVAFVVLAPLVPRLLPLHAALVPLLWLHWATNEDTCALTELEKRLRGVDEGDSFVHAVVGPVFRVQDSAVRRACWAVSAAAWAVTLARLWATRSR